ncbi:MAG: ATP phosphoribosyltransferase [Veillonella sp.]|uniref:ATP phosphoribosyltransferase n=1 Tax=Veillonella sp. TaxID=1926307 RepID=UPI00257CF923|nr:ATP phosphoribosyltransferase [Veillonella sp.]MBS6893216.1 ATP phosphoribosyltransferase [Veillonella sp.]
MVQKQLPTGFRDDIGAVAERKDDVSQYLLSLCRNRQYTKISTPLVEYKDVFNGYTLGRGQHMYEFFGSSDASVVIRPDLTMPIGRFLATTNIELPRKFYYLGDVLMKNKRADLLDALFTKYLPRYNELISEFKNNALYPFLTIWPRLFGTVNDIKNELSQVILPAGAQRILDSLMALAGQIEATGQQVRIDVSTEPLQSYYTGLTFRGYVDGVSQYIVSGGRYDGLLSGFDGTPMPSVGMAFNIDVLTDVLMQGESNIQDNGKLRIALTKGRVEKDFIPLLESCGIDCEPLRNKARKLIIPLGDSVEVILAKGPDVTTYLNNGVVDLGIVGSDVLDEQDNTSYEMLDLKTGQCQFILASLEGYNPKEGRRQRIGTKYPTITKQYFGSQDVEIIKIEGSVELAPLVGLADAIVDITETGTTLRENNLKIYDWLQPISTRLVANPLALKQKRNTIFALIDQLQAAIGKK